MRKTFLLAATLLAGCTAAQVQQAQTDVQQGQLVIDAGACAAQQAANDATTVLTDAGDISGAAETSKVSQTAGSACMTLATPITLTPPAASPAPTTGS
jgi:hypothetical protein